MADMTRQKMNADPTQWNSFEVAPQVMASSSQAG
jgi:hypothetical protein